MSFKERFVEIYRTHITREGAGALLDYLLSPQSDFFRAPASTRFHGCYEGGLCEHSLNVYDCLKAYMERDRVKEVYGIEDYHSASAAIVSELIAKFQAAARR